MPAQWTTVVAAECSANEAAVVSALFPTFGAAKFAADATPFGSTKRATFESAIRSAVPSAHCKAQHTANRPSVHSAHLSTIVAADRPADRGAHLSTNLPTFVAADWPSLGSAEYAADKPAFGPANKTTIEPAK